MIDVMMYAWKGALEMEYTKMTRQQLQEEYAAVSARFQELKGKGL